MRRGGKEGGGEVEVEVGWFYLLLGIHFRDGGGPDRCLLVAATHVTLRLVAQLRHQMDDSVSPFFKERT